MPDVVKLDPKRQLKHLYAPPAKEVGIVDVPAMRFPMVEGAGNPNKSPAFQAATEALYGVSHAVSSPSSARKGSTIP